jgi:rubrerythrin
MKKTNVITILAAVTSVILLQSFISNPTAKNAYNKFDPSLAVNSKELNIENMKEAFRGETTASAKYAAYSKKAEEEGYHEIALLFKAASVSEKIHANNHKAVLVEGGQQTPSFTPEFTVKSTKENLKDALAGETYEITTMYPQFIVNANKVGNQFSLISLNYAYKTEQKHKPLYEKALAALENNNVKSLSSVFYICPTCGNTYDTKAPTRCGISMTGSEKFIKIDSLGS